MIQRVKCCSSCFPPPNGSGEAALPPATVDGDGGIVTREEAYRQIDDLDFMKAAKILFTTPPKRKQFGMRDMEMRRMEAEAELKKKQAEEEEEKAEERKAKEAELRSMEDGSSDSELSKVIFTLDALEEVVKEIADEKRRTPGLVSKRDRDADENSDPQTKSRAVEAKQVLNKETAGGQKNKERGR